MNKDLLAAQLNGIILYHFHSITTGSHQLRIPETRLRAACKNGNIDCLRVSDLIALGPLLPDGFREELRAYVLP